MKPTRLLSLLLLLALLLTLAPAPRAAAETLSGACGKDGDNLTWSFADGVLTLEGSGAMADYASADNVPWAAFRETITAVSLPEGLTSIGARAFHKCTALTEIALPEGLTSIGDYAFSYCPLVEVSLPGSLRELGSNPFVDRGTLKGITLSPDNEAFTLLDGALITADGKTLLCYPSGLEVESFAVPEGVEEIGATAFAHCENLRSVTLPDSLRVIKVSAFFGCTNLRSVHLPEGLTEIGSGAFSECAALTLSASDGSYAAQYCADNGLKYSLRYSGYCGAEISNLSWTLADGVLTVSGEGEMMNSVNLLYWSKLSDQVTTVVVEEGVSSLALSAFKDFAQLTSVSLPESLTAIGEDAFRGCTSLSEITLPAHVVSIGAHAFRDCKALSSIALPEGLTQLGLGAFDTCTALVEIALPDSLTELANELFYDCTALTSVRLPAGLTSLGARDFRGCEALTEITLPDTLTELGEGAFAYCKGLTGITLPEGLISIGTNAFYNCEALSSVKLPDSLRSLGEEVFKYCVLKEITLPAGLTEIGDNPFTGRTLESISLSPENEALELVDGVLFSKADHRLVCAPAQLELGDYTVPEGTECIGLNAFIHCTKLTSVTLPDSVTELRDGAFWACSSLESVRLPAGLTALEEGTFAWCSSLETLNLPEGLSSIGDRAFRKCSGLQALVLPEGLESLGEAVFEDCAVLGLVRLPASVSAIGADCFQGAEGVSLLVDQGSFAQQYAAEHSLSAAPLSSAGPLGSVNSGVCGAEGENLRWLFAGNTLLIYGQGDMQDFYRNEGISAPWVPVLSLVNRVVVADGVTSIGSYAFLLGSKIAQVRLPEGLRSIGDNAFYFCSGLTEILLPEGLESLGGNAFYYCSRLTGIRFPESLRSIGDNAFYFCMALNSIRFSEGLESLGDQVFRECYALENVNALPETLQEIVSNPFVGCMALQSVTVSLSHPYLATIDGVLYSKADRRLVCCPMALGLESYTIPEGIRSIGSFAFAMCDSLQSVTLPESLTDIGEGAFIGTALSSVKLPGNLASLGHLAFAGCESLTELALPDALLVCEGNPFAGCTRLKGFTLSEAHPALALVDGVLFSTEDHRLICCPLALGLSAFSVPEDTISVSPYAFYGCGSLGSVTLPAGVTEIGEAAFEECPALTLTVTQGSYAEDYCKQEGLPYAYPDSLDWLKD